MTDKKKMASPATKLKAITADLILTPSEDQCLAKARFWRKMAENPLYSVDKMSNSQMETLAASANIPNWLSNPKFKDWFLEKDHVYHGVAALAEKAIHTLWEILEDPDSTPKTKVEVCRLALDLKGIRPPAKKEIKYADLDIQRKSPEELDHYINERVKLLEDSSS